MAVQVAEGKASGAGGPVMGDNKGMTEDTGQESECEDW